MIKPEVQLNNYKTILDEHSIVAVTDARGRITYVNDTFCDISKYHRDELLGQDHRLINSGHHPKSFFADLWKTIVSGETWKGDVKNRAKDGSFYWVKTTIMPFRDSHGKIFQYVALRTDITDKILAEEKLSKTNQRLQRLTDRLKAERMALNRKNIALNELINHVEEEKEKIRATVKGNVEIIVQPLIAQVRSQLSGVQKKYVDLIASSLDEIAEPFLNSSANLSSRLTPKELQICNHIKNGLSVKEIASLHHLSPRTVDKHRENIRKKLGLVAKKVNLTTYLMGEL